MIHRVSKIFWPQSVIPKDASVKGTNLTSKTQKLMLELGLIKSIGSGLYQMTPLIQRSLDKLVNHVCSHMEKIDGQKITLSILTPTHLWEKTGRLKEGVGEIYMIKDRQEKSYILSPTHEETITSLIAESHPISYKQLPIKLFQIGFKFRDEIKPRLGLLRTKEFIMKDMYSFDTDLHNAEGTYKEVGKQYEYFFKSLEIPWMKVKGSPGMMGGSESHEYHVLSNVGEDSITHCADCLFAANQEVFTTGNKCPVCNSNNLKSSKGIEIGHTFLLKDKYSQPLNANYLNKTGKPQNLIMGCYGIGLTRLIAASLESFSTEHELHWPTLIAPFDICIISSKAGSQEENQSNIILDQLINEITKTNIFGTDAIIHDDRSQLTIGKRLREAKKIGFPITIVIGAKALNDPPEIEYHDQRNGTVHLLNMMDLLEKLFKYAEYKKRLRLI